MPKAESWAFNSVICPEIVSPVSPVTATLCSPDAVCTANVSVTPLAIATAAIEPTATGAVLSTPVPCSPRPVALTDWPVRFTFTVELAKELWPPPIYTPRLAAFTVFSLPCSCYRYRRSPFTWSGEGSLQMENMPNHLPDPTPALVMPPAGQELRPRLGVDH